MEYLCCIVQRCSNISRMGSLDETTLNLQLYREIYLFYDDVKVAKMFMCYVSICITYILECTW